MTDHTSDVPLGRSTRRPGAEYWIYFSVIFAITLPIAFVAWALGLGRTDRGEPREGVIRHARHQAHLIASLIFSA